MLRINIENGLPHYPKKQVHNEGMRKNNFC